MTRITLILLVFSFSRVNSQEVYHQSLYWVRYANQISFSPKVQWNNEIDNRRFFDPDVENQLIIHSRLHYRWGKWEAAGGLTLSWIFAQKPEQGYDHAIAEVRPVAELSHEQPIGKVFFQNRLRVDNRFVQENPDESVWEESFFVLRFRYRAQLRIPLKKNDEEIPLVSLRVGDEIMFNSKENTFDQNRINVTFDVYITRHITFEPGYVYIYQQRFGTEDFFARHVIRFSILHKIRFY